MLPLGLLYAACALSLALITGTNASMCSKMNLGGSTSVHGFICCDNCGDLDQSCDAHTYQGGSSGSYCGSCGLISDTGGRLFTFSSSTFSCSSCSKQGACESKCNASKKRILGIKFSINTPGFCYEWAKCFKKCCRESSSLDPDAAPDTFCGDGICQADETLATCPLDCCGNSACCDSGDTGSDANNDGNDIGDSPAEGDSPADGNNYHGDDGFNGNGGNNDGSNIGDSPAYGNNYYRDGGYNGSWSTSSHQFASKAILLSHLIITLFLLFS